MTELCVPGTEEYGTADGEDGHRHDVCTHTHQPIVSPSHQEAQRGKGRQSACGDGGDDAEPRHDAKPQAVRPATAALLGFELKLRRLVVWLPATRDRHVSALYTAAWEYSSPGEAKETGEDVTPASKQGEAAPTQPRKGRGVRDPNVPLRLRGNEHHPGTTRGARLPGPSPPRLLLPRDRKGRALHRRQGTTSRVGACRVGEGRRG